MALQINNCRQHKKRTTMKNTKHSNKYFAAMVADFIAGYAGTGINNQN